MQRLDEELNELPARAINAQPWEPPEGMIKRWCLQCRYLFATSRGTELCPDCNPPLRLGRRPSPAECEGRSRDWYAQYQGRPRPPEGAMFKPDKMPIVESEAPLLKRAPTRPIHTSACAEAVVLFFPDRTLLGDKVDRLMAARCLRELFDSETEQKEYNKRLTAETHSLWQRYRPAIEELATKLIELRALDGNRLRELAQKAVDGCC